MNAVLQMLPVAETSCMPVGDYRPGDRAVTGTGVVVELKGDNDCNLIRVTDDAADYDAPRWSTGGIFINDAAAKLGHLEVPLYRQGDVVELRRPGGTRELAMVVGISAPYLQRDNNTPFLYVLTEKGDRYATNYAGLVIKEWLGREWVAVQAVDDKDSRIVSVARGYSDAYWMEEERARFSGQDAQAAVEQMAPASRVEVDGYAAHLVNYWPTSHAALVEVPMDVQLGELVANVGPVDGRCLRIVNVEFIKPAHACAGPVDRLVFVSGKLRKHNGFSGMYNRNDRASKLLSQLEHIRKVMVDEPQTPAPPVAEVPMRAGCTDCGIATAQTDCRRCPTCQAGYDDATRDISTGFPVHADAEQAPPVEPFAPASVFYPQFTPGDVVMLTTWSTGVPPGVYEVKENTNAIGMVMVLDKDGEARAVSALNLMLTGLPNGLLSGQAPTTTESPTTVAHEQPRFQYLMDRFLAIRPYASAAELKEAYDTFAI